MSWKRIVGWLAAKTLTSSLVVVCHGSSYQFIVSYTIFHNCFEFQISRHHLLPNPKGPYGILGIVYCLFYSSIGEIIAHECFNVSSNFRLIVLDGGNGKSWYEC